MNIVTEYIGVPHYGGRYRTTATIKFGKETLKCVGESNDVKGSMQQCVSHMNTLKTPLDEAYNEIVRRIG